VSYVAWVNDGPVGSSDLEVQAVVEVDLASMPIIDLHMRDADVRGTGSPSRIWKVTYRDGLYRRAEGASLVVADTAPEAAALVEAADPFEGKPFYGVPAVHDSAEPFSPKDPYVLP
jgi:hypothetical protein